MSLVPLTIPEAPPVPVLPRRRQLLVGTALVCVAASMLFFGLFGHYLEQRSETIERAREELIGQQGGIDNLTDAELEVIEAEAKPAWFDGITVPLTQPTMGFFTLVMSIFTMQWAVWSISRDDRQNTYLALGVTALLGLAFINQMAFLFSFMGIVLNSSAESAANPEAAYFYPLVGAHLVMLVGGLVFMLVAALRAFGGQFGPARPDGISAVALYWYVTVFLYAVLWYGVYITK